MPMSSLKTNSYHIIKDSLAYTIAKVIPGITGLISVVLFFRLVGAKEYGRYTIMFSFLNILAAFCFGWMSQSILRYFGRYKGTGLLARSLFKGFLLVFLISTGLISILYWRKFPIPSYVFPQISLVFSIGLFTLVRVYFQARQTPQSVVKLTSIQSVLGIIIPVLLIQLFQASHVSILLGFSLAYFISSIIVILRHCKKLKGIFQGLNTDASSRLLKTFMKYGWPLSFWYVSSLSLQFLDRFFVGKYWGLELMGSYAGFSELVTRLFSVLLFPITLAIHPRVMNLWNENKYQMSMKVIGIGITLQVSIFIFCFMGFYFFKPQLFNGILKLVPQLDRSLIYVLLPVLTGGFLWQLALLIHKPLELKEWSGLMLVMILISVGWNIAGNILFLPRYGVIATAYTSILSAISYILLSLLFSGKMIFRVFNSP